MARKRITGKSGKKRTTAPPPVEPSALPSAPPVPCPPSILQKVVQFEEQSDTYLSSGYSEAQLRIDFINPMLKALGWDVDNEAGYAEAYREVVYEDALRLGKTTKTPDYGFYIGGRAAGGGGRKFFLEAKRPSVAIRLDRMLEMHKALAAAGRPQEKERLRRDIESTDSKIDQLVYELYGLTDDEIAIVEQATAKPVDE